MKGKDATADYSGSYRMFDGILAAYTNGVNSTGPIGPNTAQNGAIGSQTIVWLRIESFSQRMHSAASELLKAPMNGHYQHQFAPLVFIECEASYGPFRTGIISAQNTHKCTVCFTADIWQHKRCDASPTPWKLAIFILISWICRQ